MENKSVSIRERRRRRILLLEFFDVLFLQLQAGYELAHAWGATLRFLQEQHSSDYKDFNTGSGGIEELLGMLSEKREWQPYGTWFQVVNELYIQGAGLCEAVKGIVLTLRKEELNDLEEHLRTLPTRLQIILLLFFFPPTVLLLIVPLLSSLQF